MRPRPVVFHFHSIISGPVIQFLSELMKFLALGGGLFGVFILIEMALRFGYGFGNPLLYIADEQMGYLLAPNQKVKRFGNRIRINAVSMRADPIAAQLETDAFRLFLLGDSIANGGWWTDQEDVLSYRIAHYLESALPAPYQRIEALNASTNSWGPRNELAYLERYGTFEATALVLLLNTDDLFGVAPTSLQVGRDRSYPSRRPALAITEVLNRYLKKPQPVPGLKAVQDEKGDRVGKNLDAVEGIYQKAVADGAQFVLVLSPLKREIAGSRDYELVARQRLGSWADGAGVCYLDLLELYQKYPNPDELYRDHIHLSSQGNELVGEAIAQAISTLSDE